MPYVTEQIRQQLKLRGPENSGELNYCITKLLTSYMARKGLTYATVNDISGALVNAGDEFYRRVAVPYEQRKCKENGDVYERSEQREERADERNDGTVVGAEAAGGTGPSVLRTQAPGNPGTTNYGRDTALDGGCSSQARLGPTHGSPAYTPSHHPATCQGDGCP